MQVDGVKPPLFGRRSQSVRTTRSSTPVNFSSTSQSATVTPRTQTPIKLDELLSFITEQERDNDSEELIKQNYIEETKQQQQQQQLIKSTVPILPAINTYQSHSRTGSFSSSSPIASSFSSSLSSSPSSSLSSVIDGLKNKISSLNSTISSLQTELKSQSDQHQQLLTNSLDSQSIPPTHPHHQYL